MFPPPPTAAAGCAHCLPRPPPPTSHQRWQPACPDFIDVGDVEQPHVEGVGGAIRVFGAPTPEAGCTQERRANSGCARHVDGW